MTNWRPVQSVPCLRPRTAGIGSSPPCDLNCRISGDKKWTGGLIIAHLLRYSGRCARCQLAATAHKLPSTRRIIASIWFKSRGVLCIKWCEIKGGRQLAVNLTCQHRKMPHMLLSSYPINQWQAENIKFPVPHHRGTDINVYILITVEFMCVRLNYRGMHGANAEMEISLKLSTTGPHDVHVL